MPPGSKLVLQTKRSRLAFCGSRSCFAFCGGCFAFRRSCFTFGRGRFALSRSSLWGRCRGSRIAATLTAAKGEATYCHGYQKQREDLLHHCCLSHKIVRVFRTGGANSNRSHDRHDPRAGPIIPSIQRNNPSEAEVSPQWGASTAPGASLCPRFWVLWRSCSRFSQVGGNIFRSSRL